MTGKAELYAQTAQTEPNLTPPEVSEALSPLQTNNNDQELDALSDNELLQRGAALLFDNQLIDARTALLKALEKNPRLFRAHMLLSMYYLEHVGHFRLALRYALRADEIFEEEYGKPPFAIGFFGELHEEISNLIVQAKLNLDDYTGALELLTKLELLGYAKEWMPSTKSWILMKLGRLDEAIEAARQGIRLYGESGRSLNILGILLSMKGEPQKSLEIFEQAVEIELSLGQKGQPATPLNNSGEVYKELFADRKAEASWVQAKSLPDGCEHVLPSLNLALLRIDHLDLQGANDSLATFLQCVAQFTQKNNEEHQALVDLARGRIALHSGQPEVAIELLNNAVQRVQWFGKIGTSSDDLLSAALSSLGLAYEFHSNHLGSTPTEHIFDYPKRLVVMARNRIARWWAYRQARIVLVTKLKNFEDLKLRNTDSLLEYPTIGSLLATFPQRLLQQKIAKQIEIDRRAASQPHYIGYLAEGYANQGELPSAVEQFKAALGMLRVREDRLLLTHLTARQLAIVDNTSDNSAALVQLYRDSPPAIRNYGLELPVRFSNVPGSLVKIFKKTPFKGMEDANWPFIISSGQGENNKITLILQDPVRGRLQVVGDSEPAAVINLMKRVFTY